MAVSETSLASLLDEQATSSRQFVIEAVPDNNEVVKVTLLTPGMRLSCDAGVTLPVTAIKSIKKTGEAVACCGKSLQAVEVTFSEEKAVSYDEVFSTVRDVHSSVTRTLVQSFRQASKPGDSTSGDVAALLAGSQEGNTGVGVARPMSYGSCMVNAMLNGPSGKRAFANWMATWANICDAIS